MSLSLQPFDVMMDEYAECLQASQSLFYKLHEDGKVPGQKAERYWRFRNDAIDRWLERRDAEDRMNAEEHE